MSAIDPCMPLLELKGIGRHFPVLSGPLARSSEAVVSILKDVNLSVAAGQTVGLVGESGSGKTTTARLILRLDEPSEGHVMFGGQAIGDLKGAALQAYRRRVQPVFQDPYSSLNPRLTIGTIVGEPLAVNRLYTRAERRERVEQALVSVGLRSDAAQRYPHEFSGGQRQRVAIARALTVEPDLLVLDEPVSALDISIRAQVMNLLDDLRQRMKLSYLLISHDLDLVTRVADRIDVMYLGTIVESGPAETISRACRHPYTKALFASKLPSHPRDRAAILPLEGELASPLNRPGGCPFHPRCPLAVERCRVEAPPLRANAGDHRVACHLAEAG